MFKFLKRLLQERPQSTDAGKGVQAAGRESASQLEAQSHDDIDKDWYMWLEDSSHRGPCSASELKALYRTYRQAQPLAVIGVRRGTYATFVSVPSFEALDRAIHDHSSYLAKSAAQTHALSAPAPAPMSSPTPHQSRGSTTDGLDLAKRLLRESAGARDFLRRAQVAGFRIVGEDEFGLEMQGHGCTLLFDVLTSKGPDRIWSMAFKVGDASSQTLVSEGRHLF